MYEMSRGEELHKEDKEVVKKGRKKTRYCRATETKRRGDFRKDRVVYAVKFHREVIIDLLKAVWVKWNRHKPN